VVSVHVYRSTLICCGLDVTLSTNPKALRVYYCIMLLPYSTSFLLHIFEVQQCLKPVVSAYSVHVFDC
jgi:hypothetical protein